MTSSYKTDLVWLNLVSNIAGNCCSYHRETFSTDEHSCSVILSLNALHYTALQ